MNVNTEFIIHKIIKTFQIVDCHRNDVSIDRLKAGSHWPCSRAVHARALSTARVNKLQ